MYKYNEINFKLKMYCFCDDDDDDDDDDVNSDTVEQSSLWF